MSEGKMGHILSHLPSVSLNMHHQLPMIQEEWFILISEY